jgi:pyruvate/2-oxoglutarate dehydrogenase complex dihydrolipoamide acyltransferase (E2) component
MFSTTHERGMIYVQAVPGPIEDVEEVRVLEWHGTAGQQYKPGDLIVELETHKAVVEVRAGQAGILRRILCEASVWEKAGGLLAVLSDTPDEAMPASWDGLRQCEVAFEIT